MGAFLRVSWGLLGVAGLEVTAALIAGVLGAVCRLGLAVFSMAFCGLAGAFDASFSGTVGGSAAVGSLKVTTFDSVRSGTGFECGFGFVLASKTCLVVLLVSTLGVLVDSLHGGDVGAFALSFAFVSGFGLSFRPSLKNRGLFETCCVSVGFGSGAEPGDSFPDFSWLTEKR